MTRGKNKEEEKRSSLLGAERPRNNPSKRKKEKKKSSLATEGEKGNNFLLHNSRAPKEESNRAPSRFQGKEKEKKGKEGEETISKGERRETDPLFDGGLAKKRRTLNLR